MKNNDLISRSALIAKYDRVHVGEPGMERKLMEDAPAVDAVPVMHGRWEKHSHSYFGNHQCTCSECKNDEYWKKFFCYGSEKYCPNCGAKMDGDAE